MGSIQDLEGLIANIGQVLQRLQGDVTAIIDRLSQAGNVPDADLQQLGNVVTALTSASEQIEAVLNPPPPPAQP